jgi:integrase
MAGELTTLACEKLKPGPKRVEIPDGRIGGLRIIVQPSGQKSWALRYQIRGRKHKLTLGQYPSIGLAQAREKAGRAKDAIQSGRDPCAERRAAKGAPAAPPPVYDLFETVVAKFLGTYAEQRLKVTTARAVARCLSQEAVAPWRGRRLSEIRRADVHDLLDAIIARGSPVSANRTLSWLKVLCSWAVERGLIDSSPCGGIKAPAAEKSRERVLSDDELAAVWRAAGSLRPPYGDFVRTILLTGARRSEIADMRWGEVSLTDKTFTLPAVRSKNGREHAFPLADATIKILRLRQLESKGDFVFSLSVRGPIRSFHSIKKYLAGFLLPDMPAWTLHDLRRTFASGCARLGIAVPVVEKCLNHRSGTFRVAVYQKHDFADEQRSAFNAWAQHVERVVSGEPANILPMWRRS